MSNVENEFEVLIFEFLAFGNDNYAHYVEFVKDGGRKIVWFSQSKFHHMWNLAWENEIQALFVILKIPFFTTVADINATFFVFPKLNSTDFP